MNGALTPDNESIILTLIRSGRIPHTVIIEGDDQDERDAAAFLLAAGAVCTGDDKPCLECTPCRKILDSAHPDLIIPTASKTSKTGILSLKDLREKYLSQVSIKPNEAPLKIYLFRDADTLLREDAQNTLLKVIEEPPQNLLFIFAVEKAKAMLGTVRSRSHIITLRHAFEPDENSVSAAEKIVDGIVSLYEYDLLLAMNALSDKDTAEGALTVVSEKLRTALLYQSGIATDDISAKKLSRKLDRRRLLDMLDVTHQTTAKLKTNVNMQLLLTWLCTQYRRITWQK